MLNPEDLRPETLDDLLHARDKISIEIAKRRTEPKVRCFKVGIKGASATYFKDFQKAKEELIEEADEDIIGNFGNTVFMEPVYIPESDFKARPDTWYEAGL